MKRFGIFILSLLAVFSISLANNIQIEPDSGDSRFPPIDKIHAGCDSFATVSIDVTDDNLTDIYVMLKYNPDDLKILRIESLQGEDKVRTVIEYDRIIYYKKIPLKKGKHKLFRIYFKSDENLEETDLVLLPDSYVGIDATQKTLDEKVFGLYFATVPECEPDVIPPNVVMIEPVNGETGVFLDSDFVFEIKDAGKGVNKNSFYAIIDDIKYEANKIVWSGDQAIVHIDSWLPVNSDVNIEVYVEDLQEYGGANSTIKDFRVLTASGVKLKYVPSLEEVRQLDKVEEKVENGSVDYNISKSECKILESLYYGANLYSQYKLRKVYVKLGCNIPSKEQVLKYKERKVKQKTISNQDVISVFAVLGWILFILTFVLKFHYMNRCKKYKKELKKKDI